MRCGTLVQDRIPEIIRFDGREPVVDALDDAACRRALPAEIVEGATDPSAAAGGDGEVLDEPADLREPIRAAAFGLPPDAVRGGPGLGAAAGAASSGGCGSRKPANTTGSPTVLDTVS